MSFFLYNKGMGKSQRKWNFHVILNSLYLAFSDILPTHASPLNPHTFYYTHM